MDKTDIFFGIIVSALVIFLIGSSILSYSLNEYHIRGKNESRTVFYFISGSHITVYGAEIRIHDGFNTTSHQFLPYKIVETPTQRAVFPENYTVTYSGEYVITKDNVMQYIAENCPTASIRDLGFWEKIYRLFYYGVPLEGEPTTLQEKFG